MQEEFGSLKSLCGNRMEKEKSVLIIAEAGVNHNGDIETAKKLIIAAKNAGADIVKFQTAKLDSLVSSEAEMADYQKTNMESEMTQKEMLKKLLLPFEDFKVLSDYCKLVGIEFLSTPFDLESIDFLEPLVNFWKIPSGEITNYPYLKKIAETNKPIVMSTGMCTLTEIDDAVKVLKENGAGKIALLHCNTQYPTPYEDVNLNAMDTLKNRYNCEIGYSDHTQGIEVSIAAVAMGATIIEKHFTLDRNQKGPDHKASLEVSELADMISKIRNIEKALGKSDKLPSASESANINVARKSIVAKRDIKKGDIFTEENITTKRPGTGISPMKWEEIIGTEAIRDFSKDKLIQI